jgi:tetratricopeptide (TPR) repeat protein
MTQYRVLLAALLPLSLVACSAQAAELHPAMPVSPQDQSNSKGVDTGAAGSSVSNDTDNEPKTEGFEDYLRSSKELGETYHDETVAAMVARGQKNTKSFISVLAFNAVGLDHGPPWLPYYNTAVEEANRGNWDEARANLSFAASVPPNKKTTEPEYVSYAEVPMADIYFIRALVDKASGRYADSIQDLKSLYELHKKEPSICNADSRVFGNFLTFPK